MAAKAYAKSAMFDVNQWFNMALFLYRINPAEYLKAIHNQRIWNTGSNSLFSDALNGKYGRLVATSHVWRTLSYTMINHKNPEARLPEQYVRHIISVFKKLIIATGGEPEVVVPLNKDAVDSVLWKCYSDRSSVDYEDAKLVYEALMAKVEVLITSDTDLSMAEVPGLKIWYHDTLTSEQRRNHNATRRRPPR
jgi:hypothetical protein